MYAGSGGTMHTCWWLCSRCRRQTRLGVPWQLKTRQDSLSCAWAGIPHHFVFYQDVTALGSLQLEEYAITLEVRQFVAIPRRAGSN